MTAPTVTPAAADVTYTWMTPRKRFIEACAKTMLEMGIPQANFHNEAQEFFQLALKHHLRANFHHGQPTHHQIMDKEQRLYIRFKNDLKALVYDDLIETWEDYE